MRITTVFAAAAALVIAGTTTAFANPDEAVEAQPNIVEVAAQAGTFNTLLAAATEAGLAETLANGGPFTVFAPTDEAFAKIPQADLEALLADKEALTKVLLYHVVEGEHLAEKVVGMDSVETLAGEWAPISLMDGKAMIDGATITATNIRADNGVIHVIDTVILP